MTTTFHNLDSRVDALRFRLKLCSRTLSNTNMILAYTILEEIFVFYFQNEKIQNLEEKKIERFDKMKARALGNTNLNERKVSFTMSIQIMEKILDLKFL